MTNTSDHLERLLSDENFQDDILNDKTFTDQRSALMAKYSVSEKELTEARKLFSGLSWVEKKQHQQEVGYALKKLQDRISPVPDLRRTQKRRMVTLFVKIAAVLSVPLLVSTIYFYQQSRSTAVVAPSAVFSTFHAPAGAKSQLTLPDGSRVWLNSGSSVSYPARFEGNVREVRLAGEAYFEITRNMKVPLLVFTAGMRVKVYGTKFNVNAFAGKGVIETTLVEGKVAVIPEGSGQEYPLEPGYTASYTLSSQRLQIKKVDQMAAFTGWKEGKLAFHNERFADILAKMERWYNVDLVLKDRSLSDYVLYATFLDENVEDVLTILSKSIPITMDYPQRVKMPDGSYARRTIVIGRDINKN